MKEVSHVSVTRSTALPLLLFHAIFDCSLFSSEHYKILYCPIYAKQNSGELSCLARSYYVLVHITNLTRFFIG